MQKLKKSERKIFCLVFAAVLFLSCVILALIFQYKENRSIEYGNYLLGSEATSIEHSIDLRMLKLQALEMVVVANEDSLADFDEIAAELCKDDSAIQSLSLIPNGTAAHTYSAENHTITGTAAESPVTELTSAILPDSSAQEKLPNSGKDDPSKEKMTLEGPIQSEDGTSSILIKRPIYTKKDTDRQSLWGYCSAALDIEKLFSYTSLNQLEKSGYSYMVWKNESDTKECVIGNVSQMPENAITEELSLPGESWYLSIVPVNGWLTPAQITFYIFMALLIDILFTFFVFYLIRSLLQKRELDKLAHVDPLTGLHNTRYLTDTFTRLQQQQQPFLLFMLDMNKFKQVNDTYGHKAGDTLLTETAHRLRQCIRDTDYAFRIGGDEFCLIVPSDASAPDGNALIEQIKATISQPLPIDNVTLHMQTSCGFASYPSESTDFKVLMQLADERMYHDKASTKASVID